MIFQSFVFCIFLMIVTANGQEPSNPTCDCTNPVYIDQPTNIVQCSRSKFVNQVKANYDIVYGFIDQKSAKHCNYSVYRSIVNEMKSITLQLVDSYFKCTKRDCMPAIKAAFKKYGATVNAKFIPFLWCSYTYFSPECAVNIKHATFFSAENILSTLTECATLKAARQRPNILLFLIELLRGLLSKKTPDCNCVKIDERPIPVSEEQCYSSEYFTTLNNFISDNFDRIKGVYHEAQVANPQCNYSKFINLTETLEEITNQWPKILQESDPTFEKLTFTIRGYPPISAETNKSIRQYILEHDKSCYFTPRQLRQSALTVSNYVVQILTKCVQYRDPSHSKC